MLTCGDLHRGELVIVAYGTRILGPVLRLVLNKHGPSASHPIAAILITLLVLARRPIARLPGHTIASID
jgi:hypothetical protein